MHSLNVKGFFRTLSITLSAGSGRRSLGHLTPTSHLAKESAGKGEGETDSSFERVGADGQNNGRLILES